MALRLATPVLYLSVARREEPATNWNSSQPSAECWVTASLYCKITSEVAKCLTINYCSQLPV